MAEQSIFTDPASVYPEDRRRARGLATKQALIEAGMKLFGEQGFSGTSTREIAREARCNLGLISFHFGTKDHLYREVRKALKDHLKSTIDPIVSRLRGLDGSKLKDCELLKVLSGEIRVVLEENFVKAHDSSYYILLRRSLKAGDEGTKELFSEVFLPLFEEIEKLLNEHSGSGFSRRNKLRAFLIIDGVFGVLRDHEFLSAAPGITEDLKADTGMLSEMIGSLAVNG